jgi:hypothetical protein
MTAPRKTTTSKPKIEKEPMSERIKTLSDVIQITIPANNQEGIYCEQQEFKSIWNEKELEILKTSLLDLATRL